MSLHAAVVALIAFMCGAVVGGLTFWMNGSTPGALLAGLGATAFTFMSLYGRIR